MVPTMCSVDEQLNTSQPNDKHEAFPARPNLITSDKPADDKQSSNSVQQVSGQTTQQTNSAKVNSDTNNNTQSVNKSEELNDQKRHSLALNRHESVTVYRDPNLADKQIIRHIDSVQHLRHGLMHSVNTVNTTTASAHTESSMGHPADYGRMSSSGLATRPSQPPASILPPSVTSMASMPQYKMKSHPPPQQPHLLTAGSHNSLPHSNSVDPQLYHHLMGLHPGLSAQSLEMLWQQKGYSPLSSLPANSHWGLYSDQIRAQLLHQDKHQTQTQQAYRLDRFVHL